MLDNREVAVDITRAAEEASNLDAENLTDAMLASVTVATEALHAFYLYELAVDPGLGTAPPYSTPNFSATGITLAQPVAAWQVIGSASVTFTCGEADLDIIGWAQWFTDLWSSAIGSPPPNAIQLGIRIDGQVIYYTGCPDLNTVPFHAARATVQRDATHMEPGPATPKDQDQSAGIGTYHDFTRLTASYTVAAGAHTVDLVVRLIPQTQSALTAVQNVYIFSRKIGVMVREVYPAVVTTATSTSVASIPTETTLSATEMLTNRLDIVRAALNGIVPGQIRRGAVQARHAPAVLLDGATSSIGGTPTYANTNYPGFTSVTITTTRDAVTPASGWFLVDDDTGPPGVPLAVGTIGPTPTHGAFAIGGVACLVKIFASVALLDVSLPGSASINDNCTAFVLLYKNVGSATIIQVPCTVGIMANFAVPDAGITRGATACKTRVSLQGWLDFRTVPNAANIDWIAVYNSNLDLGGGDDVETTWRLSNLNVIVYRR